MCELEAKALRDSEANMLSNVEELHEDMGSWENCDEYAGWYDDITGEPLMQRVSGMEGGKRRISCGRERFMNGCRTTMSRPRGGRSFGHAG